MKYNSLPLFGLKFGLQNQNPQNDVKPLSLITQLT